MTPILRIDASARVTDSVSRTLTTQIIDRLAPEVTTVRDLTTAIPQLDEAWITASHTPADQRSAQHRAALSLSDTLVAEVMAADTLVIGLPIYNFGVPAALKAWVDQIARVGVTFQYTPTGAKGLLTDKRAIIAVASGGTEAGSDIDFATGYMRHVLGFVGITDVAFVTADRLAIDPDASHKVARAQIDALAA